MPRFNRQELLQQLEDVVIQLIQTGSQELAGLPPRQLEQPPGPEQWSVAQCLEHLNSYGRYYLPILTEALRHESTQPVPPYFQSSWLGNYFAKVMRPGADGRIGMKMRAFKAHRPAATLNAGLVLADFLQQQQQLLQLLREAQHKSIDKPMVPVSIAHWLRLSVGDTFRFLIAHTQRHVVQAQRAAQAVREGLLND